MTFRWYHWTGEKNHKILMKSLITLDQQELITWENKLINVIYNFRAFYLKYYCHFMFAFQKVFLLTLTMTYSKLMKYIFVSKDEIFIFLSLLEPSRSWLHQLTPLWTWWLTANRLQLVIVIIFNLFSIIFFSNCLWFVSLSALLWSCKCYYISYILYIL